MYISKHPQYFDILVLLDSHSTDWKPSELRGRCKLLDMISISLTLPTIQGGITMLTSCVIFCKYKVAFSGADTWTPPCAPFYSPIIAV